MYGGDRELVLPSRHHVAVQFELGRLYRLGYLTIACIYANVCMYACMWVCLHMCVYVCMHVRYIKYIYACMLMYCIHVCMYACMYEYI